MTRRNAEAPQFLALPNPGLSAKARNGFFDEIEENLAAEIALRSSARGACFFHARLTDVFEQIVDFEMRLN